MIRVVADDRNFFWCGHHGAANKSTPRQRYLGEHGFGRPEAEPRGAPIMHDSTNYVHDSTIMCTTRPLCACINEDASTSLNQGCAAVSGRLAASHIAQRKDYA